MFKEVYFHLSPKFREDHDVPIIIIRAEITA